MIATIEPTERKQTLKPLVQYFPPDSLQTVAAGEMVHDYYGVPPWLMQQYLLRLGAAELNSGAGDNLYQRGQCWMQVAPAPCKRIGPLAIGGARVEFSGAAGAIQAALTELEWMTQRW
jgi:hypothetical protein